jgi:3-oxoadipate enol-lactonase
MPASLSLPILLLMIGLLFPSCSPAISTASDELILPYVRYNYGTPSVLATHGLGTVYPKNMDHTVDSLLHHTFEQSVLQINMTYIGYTARGHGKSKGWESTAESNLEQFMWPNLADDMIYLADAQNIDRFIAGGVSQGGTTALYAAIKYPNRVLGVIMMRTPTGWETRLRRRETMQQQITKLEEEGDLHRFVLEGAMLSDYPTKDDESYSRINCPVLIMSYENDPGHPTSSAIILHELMPHSQLVIAASRLAADREWPEIIENFLESIRIDLN